LKKYHKDLSDKGKSCVTSLKIFLLVAEIWVIKEPSGFLQVGLLIIRIPVVTIRSAISLEHDGSGMSNWLAWPGCMVQRTWPSSLIRQIPLITCRSHELLVSGEGMKDVIFDSLVDGIQVNRPCQCERLRMSHEENENCLTLKRSIPIKDLVNVFGHDPMVTAFSVD
jgi:hypothetical protein